MRCPTSWREMHHGWMLRIHQWLRPVPAQSVAVLDRCDRRLSLSAAFTYHWSISRCSMTTPERSPCGTLFNLLLAFDQLFLGKVGKDLLARFVAVHALVFLGTESPPSSLRRH